MYALVDVDAMYASCEQVLQPWLRGRPVVVLSNNDGCVIARSREAKALGIAMGQPWFQVARDPWMREVVARSANFELYGDLSSRLLAIVERYTPWIQPYSIDECYLALPRDRAAALARQLRDQVDRWLDLPVSIGIAPTRTLAHVATEQAKRNSDLGGVCEWDEPEQWQDLLEAIPVTEVWGIAERMAQRLAPCGIHTAAELARTDPGWARRRWSVEVERTIRELRGTACIPLEHDPPPRQQIVHSRHLGQAVTSRAEVAEVAAVFAERVARRLRRHDRVTPVLTVQLATGAFAPGPRTSVQATQTLPAPTAATRPLAATAAKLARQAWRPRYHYRRVTVLAADLTTPEDATRPLDGLTSSVEVDDRLSAALDTLTTRYSGTSVTIGFGRAGLRRPPAWAQRQHRLWPVSTTRWDRLPVVHC
ncbi:Y-family DNA polymerase [Salinifilum ghardaiensis]